MYTIERANFEQDFSFIVSSQLEMALETEGLKLDQDLLRAGVKSVFDDASKAIYFVAKKDGQTIASTMITFEWSDWRDKQVWWIQSVYVLSEYRGQGVFKAMYQYLKERVRGDETLAGLRLYVDKTNTNAQKVYHKLAMTNEHYELFEWMK
jgi:GNAT superfamily N-acetyltransferase